MSKKDWSKREVGKRMLKSAGFQWFDGGSTKGKPINPNSFDAAIDMIFKANAIEVEKLYDEIEDARAEIIQGLCNLLLPEESARPEPGYTLAQINPKFSLAKISPEDSFEIKAKDETGSELNVYLSPIFQHDFPKCQISYMLSDAYRIQVNGKEFIEIATPDSTLNRYEKSDHLWIGLDVEKLQEDSVLTLFLGNSIPDGFDPCFLAFQAANCTINGESDKVLQIDKGLSRFETGADSSKLPPTAEGGLGIMDEYEKNICNQFKDSFLTLSGFPESIEGLKRNTPPGYEGVPAEDSLLWIKLTFKLDIPKSYFLENPLYINCIPLINRRLISRNVSSQNHPRMILPLRTQDNFLAMGRVWDDGPNTEDYQELNTFSSQPDAGNYVLRKGRRIRRMDKTNASAAIDKVLNLIYEEAGLFRESGVNNLNQDFKAIDQAIGRIQKSLPDSSSTEDTPTEYFAIANIREQAFHIFYTYWECQGVLPRQYRNLKELDLQSSDINIENSFTIIPIQSGREGIKEEVFLDQLKFSLTSRNRIITRGDIEIFCRKQLHNVIHSIQIENKVVPSNKELFKMERVVLVSITLQADSDKDKEERQFMKAALQNELNARSSFYTPIKVEIEQA